VRVAKTRPRELVQAGDASRASDELPASIVSANITRAAAGWVGATQRQFDVGVRACTKEHALIWRRNAW
jgi:hypothetical protein